MTHRGPEPGVSKHILDHGSVGHDERVAEHGVRGGELGERQRPLVGVKRAAKPVAGVGRDLAGVDVQAHATDQQPGLRRPPVRAAGGHRDLRAGHVDRAGPRFGGDAVEDPP
jgi:hypothetical protein